MKVHVLHKRSERRGERTAAQLAAAGHEVVPLVSTDEHHIGDLLVGEGMERLIVVGGDGMVHHAIQHIAGTEVVLGIVPAGTGNDIARALGIGRRSPAASGPGIDTDLIRVTDADGEGRWVASILTAGFSGRVNEHANAMKRLSGSAKYTVATLSVLRTLDSYQLDGVDGFDSYSILALANTRYFGGGMAICPGASPDDGLIEVVLVDAIHPAHLTAVLPSAFIGQHVRSRRVHRWEAERLDLCTDADWWADGEPLPHRGPVTVEAVAGAIRIARPG